MEIQIDDVVANTVQHVSNDGSSNLFESIVLPGGHAEYVRVPDADRTLIKIAVSGEERSVLAGGTVGLGVQAAAIATANAPHGTYRILSCGPLGITVLSALNSVGAKSRSSAIDIHPARKTLASRLASAVSDSVMGLDCRVRILS
jgi:threonine dehydrogenase-like Zn-dependent dehydrogenase